MKIFEAQFRKHKYGRQTKHQMSPLESFDPRPEAYRGTVRTGLGEFLQVTKGMGLCVSLLFDESTRVWKPPSISANADSTPPTPVEYNIPSKSEIQAEVQSFKASLTVSESDVCRIERGTREQCTLSSGSSSDAFE